MKKNARRSAPSVVNNHTTGVLIKGGDPAEVQQAIMAILGAPHADQSVKMKALDVLERASSINNMQISNCTISMPHDAASEAR